MQIVDYIPHQRYKITVFKSGSRFILKFDDADHDLSIKYREGEVKNMDDVRKTVDVVLLKEVDRAFAMIASVRLNKFREATEDYLDII